MAHTKEYNRAYYLKNREKLIGYNRSYHLANKKLKENPIRSNAYIKHYGEMNDFDIDGDTLIVWVGCDYILFDLADAWILSLGRIHISAGYGSVKRLPVHRAILNNPNGIVDHINRKTRDNRRSNIRVVNKSLNGFNSFATKNSKSIHNGVSIGRSGRFVAYICPNGKKTNLGTYDTEDEAAQARMSYEHDNNLMCAEMIKNKEKTDDRSV